MAQNTIENKERFMALYWGQNVLNLNGEDKVDYAVFMQTGRVESAFLQLRPLYDITDHEETEVAVIVQSWNSDQDQMNIGDVSEWIDEVFEGNCATRADYVSGDQMVQIIDYLRSRGFLLPYLDLSIEQILEYKWALIKSNV